MKYPEMPFLMCLGGCLDMSNVCAPESTLMTTLRIAPSIVAGSALVTGGLRRPANMTINSLLVDNVAATSLTGDFDQFSATIPLAPLLAARDPVTGTIAAMINASTDCAGAQIAVTSDSSHDLIVTLAPSFTPASLTMTDASSAPISVQFYGFPAIAPLATARSCTAIGAAHLDIQTTDGSSLKGTAAMPNPTGSLPLTVVASGVSKGDALELVCQDENGNQSVLTITIPG